MNRTPKRRLQFTLAGVFLAIGAVAVCLWALGFPREYRPIEEYSAWGPGTVQGQTVEQLAAELTACFVEEGFTVVPAYKSTFNSPYYSMPPPGSRVIYLNRPLKDGREVVGRIVITETPHGDPEYHAFAGFHWEFTAFRPPPSSLREDLDRARSTTSNLWSRIRAFQESHLSHIEPPGLPLPPEMSFNTIDQP